MATFTSETLVATGVTTVSGSGGTVNVPANKYWAFQIRGSSSFQGGSLLIAGKAVGDSTSEGIPAGVFYADAGETITNNDTNAIDIFYREFNKPS